jgi:hypothetical protein
LERFLANEKLNYKKDPERAMIVLAQKLDLMEN